MASIKMLRSAKGSENGYTVSFFSAGETYEVTQELADSFTGDGLAELVTTKVKATGPKEDK